MIVVRTINVRVIIFVSIYLIYVEIESILWFKKVVMVCKILRNNMS